MISGMGGSIPHFQARFKVNSPQKVVLGAADVSGGSTIAGWGALNLSVAQANLPANYYWGPASIAGGAATTALGSYQASKGLGKAELAEEKKVSTPK